MNEADQAQREVIEATGQLIGLAVDLAGAAADAFRGPEKGKTHSSKDQDPAIPSLDLGDRDLKAQSDKKVSVVVDSNSSIDFTKGQIPQDFGIPELKGVDPSQLAKVDRDLAVTWGMGLSEVNRVNESRRSIGADMQSYKEPEAVQNIKETRDSLQKQIKEKGYTNEQLRNAAPLNQSQQKDQGLAGSVLDAVDNAPAPIPAKAQEKIDNAPRSQPSKQEIDQNQRFNDQNKAPEVTEQNQPQQDGDQPQPSVNKSEKAQQPNEKSPANRPESQVSKKASEVNQRSEQPKVEQPRPTASNPRQAKSEINSLGKSIEAQLKEILKADKVEARIYSGSNRVYPPDSNTKISPEMSDKLNRAFTDPQSVKGTITLSLRDDEGKLTPIYKVSQGKVVKDDFGLQKAIAQSLPEAQKVESKTEQKTDLQPELKSQTRKQDAAFSSIEKTMEKGGIVPSTLGNLYENEKELASNISQTNDPNLIKDLNTQRDANKQEYQKEQGRVDGIIQGSPGLQKQYSDYASERGISSVNPVERQNEINQSNPQQRDRRPSPDEVILRQSQRIKEQQSEIQSLKSQLQKTQKLEKQLIQANVPTGLIAGLKKHAVNLGDRIGNNVTAVQAKVVEQTRKIGNSVDQKLTDIESATVYRAAAYLAKEYGQKQSDDSQQFKANNQYNINLKKDGKLTISRVNGDKATIFAGNQQRSRFKQAANLKELKEVKSLPLAVGKIRHEQQQASRTQKQAATQKQSSGMVRKR